VLKGKYHARYSVLPGSPVGIFDVTPLQVHYGYPAYLGLQSCPAAPVPAPSTLAPAAMGLDVLAAWFKKTG
jgi:hypothetical protein